MRSRATPRFWAAFQRLPPQVQERARAAYQLFRDDQAHPSLRFKKIHDREPIYSVRIGLGYRALGLLRGNEVTWFWIGTHSDYDRLVNHL